MELRDARRASRHLRRAQKLLNPQGLGFGVNPELRKLTEEEFTRMETLPKSMCCPVTYCPMVNPVVTVYGHSYERSAIEEYVKMHGTCPQTRKPLNFDGLIPNLNLRQAIEEHCAALGFRPPDIVYLNVTEKAWHEWCAKRVIRPSEHVLEMKLGEIGDTLSMNDLEIGKSCYVETKTYKDQEKVSNSAKGCITFQDLQYFQNDESFKIVVWGIGLGGHEDTQLFDFTYILPGSWYSAEGYPLGWNLTYKLAPYIYGFQFRCSQEQLDQQRAEQSKRRSHLRYHPY